jgi:hypothetical protein
VYCGHPSQRGGEVPARVPAAGAIPGNPPKRPASPPSDGRPAVARRPSLRDRIGGEWTFLVLKLADVIYAVDIDTHERCGLFYGDPELEWLPVANPTPWTVPAVLEVPVDRYSNELETLAEMIRFVKGSCSFVGDLRKELQKRETVADLRAADIIYAVDGETDERCGLFYGDPATESLPIDPLRPWLEPAVMEVRVNALSDDREVLANAVFKIKGSRCYATDLRKVLRDPEVLEDLTNADIIYAIDRASEGRCGLFYGDPATESLPIYRLQPLLQPAVLEVFVDPLSDDRKLLAEAVRDIKGSCCYPIGDEEAVRIDPQQADVQQHDLRRAVPDEPG